ncbi:MAG: ABC transporter permease [Planctomycetes bacterium]|nr:ABC transporter permease [Planctomycetota bacterium]
MTRRLHPLLAVLAIVALAALYAPLAAVAYLSVNVNRQGFAWRGFTLNWYARLLGDSAILEAALNTLVLAVVSTAVATVLGTLLAIAMARFPWPRGVRRAFDLLVYLPVVTPDILFAAALVVAFQFLRGVSPAFRPGLLNMVLGHVSFQIAFVALVVGGRLATLGRSLEEAARDLYATPWYLFRRVTLPLLAPGIAAGAMLAFTLSLDDFVISFFTYSVESRTLPILIYASLRQGVSPEIHALSTLIVLATVCLVVALEALTRFRKE